MLARKGREWIGIVMGMTDRMLKLYWLTWVVRGGRGRQTWGASVHHIPLNSYMKSTAGSWEYSCIYTRRRISDFEEEFKVGFVGNSQSYKVPIALKLCFWGGRLSREEIPVNWMNSSSSRDV